MAIPKNILERIRMLYYRYPSRIQGVAIPMITGMDKNNDFVNLIVQSYDGSGKTVAYTIGTVLRIDPEIPKTQVLVVCHRVELRTKIFDVYE